MPAGRKQNCLHANGARDLNDDERRRDARNKDTEIDRKRRETKEWMGKGTSHRFTQMKKKIERLW